MVFIEFGEPKNSDGLYALSTDGSPTKWGNFNETLADRLRITGEKGAKAILIAEDGNFSRLLSRFEYLAASNRENMTLASELTQELPPIFIGPEFADDLNAMLQSISQGSTVKGDFDFRIKSGNEKVATENVAAVIKGTELPYEYVIISSHLDHIGVNGDGQINNGADDDGSGTVALLEIAQAFKKAADEGLGPKRSVLFLTVTGEEKGLLGLRFYTHFAPIFPF